MFDHKHYVPVLKAKRAEFPALADMKDQGDVTPILEAIPGAAPAWIGEQMGKAWKSARPYFVDGLFLDDEEFDESPPAEHPILPVLRAIGAAKQATVPVTGTGRSAAYQQAIATVISEQGKGAAIRLVREDFDDEDELEIVVDAVLSTISVAPDNVDLIIDLATVAGEPAATVASIMRANLSLTPRIADWRSVTVLSGAFPLGLGPLVRGAWNSTERSDWQGWSRVVRRPDRVPRLPAFGDYTIAHPDLPPTGRATILAQLRYSIAEQFMIWKGGNVFKHARGFDQFLDICRDLVQRPWYDGRDFSWGDGQIYQKATAGGSPGNAETWRRIALNHHLEKVKDQLANFSWP